MVGAKTTTTSRRARYVTLHIFVYFSPKHNLRVDSLSLNQSHPPASIDETKVWHDIMASFPMLLFGFELVSPVVHLKALNSPPGN